MNTADMSQGRPTLGFLAATALIVSLAGCSTITIRKEMHEANALYKADQFEQALPHYKKVANIDPSYKDAWLNMGFTYRALYHPGSTHSKDVEYVTEGIAALRKFLELDPTNEQAQQFFLAFCRDAERYDDAISYFEAELKKDPNNAQLIRSIASMYGKKNDVDNAVKWYRRWTEVEPNNPETWYTIGVACWERSYKFKSMISSEERADVISKGIEALGKALKIKPDYFDALSYMNLIYREKADLEANQGNAAAAGADFETAGTYMKKAMEVRNAQMKAQAASGG